MEPRIQYAKTSEGVSIAYATAGSAPAVVWIQNVFQSHVQLAWEQPVLRGGYEAIVASGATLVRFDPRGSGLFDRNVEDVSSAAFVDDLEAVADQLQIDKFSIVSIEWGSAAAIGYTVRHPERVSRNRTDEPSVGRRVADGPRPEVVGAHRRLGAGD